MGLAVGKVSLEPYNPKWAKDFAKEAKELKKIFGDKVPIEHVGSTSVPGLSAKPIIDIAVGLDKLSDFDQFRPVFEKLPQYSIKEDSDPDEWLVRKGGEENRTHFIHVIEKGSSRFKNYIKFREHLRSNPGDLKKYEDLKKDLATKYADDRKKYTAAKADFIAKILEK